MLTDTELELLDFEAAHLAHTGNKQALIRARFGWSAPRYYQQLHALAGRADAVDARPQLASILARRHVEHAAQRQLLIGAAL